jgi:two-component system, OmpR family, response regulator MprA
MATRVLLVDDDSKIVSLVRRGLLYEGYEVITAVNGTEALAAVRAHRPHVVLLDIAMPGPDGVEVCRRLRLDDDVPVIMLTARDDVTAKVAALDTGADDYVAKPFAFDELLARIRAVLRRRQSGAEPLIYADVTLDSQTRQASRAGQLLDLTAREYELLALFLRYPRQVLTREQILERLWGQTDDANANALEVHIVHLRRKLEAAGGSRLVQTIRGIGYVLRESPTPG